MYSEESDEDSEEVDIYRKKYQLIVEKCEVIQQDNERLVNRIHQIKKILKRRRKERKFLMDRLDMHGDSWRNLPLPLKLEDRIGQNPIVKNPIVKLVKSVPSTPGGENKLKKSGVKRKVSHKTDKNAPKRPANPYFQFCQEQRNSTIEEMTSAGQVEPSKVDVTKHLAHKWNLLTDDDKKIYYDMYEKSKERYNADMQLYTLAKNAENTSI